MTPFIGFGVFVMMQKQMVGIRDRAQRLAGDRRRAAARSPAANRRRAAAPAGIGARG